LDLFSSNNTSLHRRFLFQSKGPFPFITWKHLVIWIKICLMLNNEKAYSHGAPLIFGLTPLGYFEIMTLKLGETIWEQPFAIHKVIFRGHLMFIKNSS
jgi:hypothetical protein